jgi:hypothetical protein
MIVISDYIIHVQCILLLVLFILWFGKISADRKEGFAQDSSFVLKQNDEIYDTFYMQIYDELYIPSKYVKKISSTIVKYRYTKSDPILVICITGDQAKSLQTYFDEVHIINSSNDTVSYIKNKYPSLQHSIKCDDVMRSMNYETNSFTFILFIQFSIYKYPEISRKQIFENIDLWLVDHGILFIELVEPHQFDTVLPIASKYIDLQKHTTKRILENEVDFQSFSYNNSFVFKKNNLLVSETFVDKETKFVRKNEQVFYMFTIKEMIQEFLKYGFIVKGKITVTNSKYIYMFQKKNNINDNKKKKKTEE